MTARIAIAAALLAGTAAPAAANEFRPMLEELAEGEMQALLAEPALVTAVREQNGRHSGLSEDEIVALDEKWRGQVGSADTPLIDAVTGSATAALLREKQEASGGLFAEIFLMDSTGLTVASSNVTSDYWQGDEAKWQESYGAGADAVHIGAVEFDESSQAYLSQVSLPVVDPETGEAIGAATFGVNVELLP